MINKKYRSGNSKIKSDFYVEYIPRETSGIKISTNLRSQSLYGNKLNEICNKVCSDLKIKNGEFTIIDNGGQYFTLQARIESVIKDAWPKISSESLPKLQSHSLYESNKDRFRRSRLYLPGNQAKLMLNAGIHKPDGIILDLEDSVSPSEKQSARFIARNALRHLDFFGSERMVRINQGELGLKDLKAVIPQNVHLILVPKVEASEDLVEVDKQIIQISKKCGRKEPVYLMPILESAKGILNAFEIASSTKNNVALAIGLEDYTADIGVERSIEGKESLFARSQLINAARSANIQAIDTVFSDVSDEVSLRSSTKAAKELGFDGKGCIHPRQIKPIHEEFSPSTSQIQRAKDIVLAFDDAQKQGLGVVSLGNKMIDPPVVKRSQKTIQIAISMKLIPETWKKS
tara:strand:- start:74 stop:1282 length:1209 start_codon:yes stop_codon:yes gene_type:complete